MHFRGRVEADSQDPALEIVEQLRRMPAPVFGLVPQRHLEDWDAFGLSSSAHDGRLASCEVSISYTLWRNPHNIDDPVNLAELDEEARELAYQEIARDRPRWLRERVRRMRYPLLWEAVVTHWSADPRDDLEARLVAHVNHVLLNRFQESRATGALPPELDSPVDERHVEHGVRVRLDGFERSGIRIDTDPDVYGVGVAVDEHTVVTAALPRDELRFIEVAFARRPL